MTVHAHRSTLSTMKTLYDPSAAEEIKQRFSSLTPETPSLWGKMNVSQMLAHCAINLETVVGDRVLPRVMIGRLIGPLFKSQFTNDKPWNHSSPTAPGLITSGDYDFAAERARLFELIDRFPSGGPDACTTAPHCFFGKLSPEEWGKGTYKHLDHHLTQFGA
jgi:hypothetical protein